MPRSAPVRGPDQYKRLEDARGPRCHPRHSRDASGGSMIDLARRPGSHRTGWAPRRWRSAGLAIGLAVGLLVGPGLAADRAVPEAQAQVTPNTQATPADAPITLCQRANYRTCTTFTADVPDLGATRFGARRAVAI